MINVAGTSREHRTDLMRMSAKELKELANLYEIDCRACVEKGDFVHLLKQHEERYILERECLARYAIRVAVRDSKRTLIHQSGMKAPSFLFA